MAVTKYPKPAAQRPVSIQGADFDVAAECTTDVGTTAEIDKRGFPFGSFEIPSGSGITSITWYRSRATGVAGVTHKDEDGQQNVMTVAVGGYELPSHLAGVPFLLPVTNDDGPIYFHFER